MSWTVPSYVVTDAKCVGQCMDSLIYDMGSVYSMQIVNDMNYGLKVSTSTQVTQQPFAYLAFAKSDSFMYNLLRLPECYELADCFCVSVIYV